jgi:hypothetical protein
MRREKFTKQENHNEKTYDGGQKNKYSSFPPLYNADNSGKKGEYTGNSGKEARNTKYKITENRAPTTLAGSSKN